MSEFATLLQGQVYSLDSASVSNLHWVIRRLNLVYGHITSPGFGATEGLRGQIGDTAVDLVLKSFRLQESVSDGEFTQLLSVMQARHWIALASGWASFGKVPRGTFAGYYLKRAFEYIKYLQQHGLSSDANSLAQAIDKKTAAIQGHQDDLEGTWEMKDERGVKYRLVVVYAAEEMMFACFGDTQEKYLRPFFNVIYDMKHDSFVASERPIDVDRSANRMVRFYSQDDGTLKVVDIDQPFKAPMIARRVQSYPDILNEGVATGAPNLDGTYVGQLKLPSGNMTFATLSITVYSNASVGNIKMLDGHYDATLNFGTPADNGVVYLTRGSFVGAGTWMQIRAKLGSDGILRGYTIYGGSGMVPYEFAFKKVR